MDIINPRCSLLCNSEVFEILKNIKDTKRKHGPRNLATIIYETLHYLEDSTSKHRTRESIVNFIKEVTPYRLTPKECVMIINDPPTSVLHVQLIVEDSEDRLTEAHVSELLAIVEKHFPKEQTDSSNG